MDRSTTLDPKSDFVQYFPLDLKEALMSPKGWAGASVGIGTVLEVGIPLIEKRNQVQMSKFL